VLDQSSFAVALFYDEQSLRYFAGLENLLAQLEGPADQFVYDGEF